MEQWQAYNDPASAGGQRRYNGNTGSQMSPRDFGSGAQNPAQQPPAGFKYDNYQGGLNPHQTPPSATSPMASPLLHDGNGDVPMQDSHDSYATLNPNAKYPMRPHHQQHPSSGRTANLQQEPSAAAQRYSPMEVLSPTSPYGPKSSSASQFSQQPAQRQSPTRSSDYAPQQSPYYNTRQAAPQLPPINPYGGSQDSYSPSAMTPMDGSYVDPKSPKRAPQPQQQQQSTLQDRGPVPEFKRIRASTDLKPKVNSQPAFRRANPEGGFLSPLQALTVQLPATYRICNPGFKYESSRNPRRVLTKPSKGLKNDGYDNEDSDYILYVNDILGSEEAGHKYDFSPGGTFGQVVKCQNMKTQEVVAVKVIKNRTAYFNQSMMEVSVLDLLNTKLDKNDDHHLLRLKDTFIHRQHLCLVFELLSVNLYELIKQNQFRGLSTTLVRVFAQQLLNGLALLNKARLIHCDLKPENILLKNLESPIIKIIDFGSACDERQTVYTYIQSRFYRSPEVLLGLPYSSAIDMWSLGCIVVELFLGLPLFPGSSEYNQVSRIVEMLGNPPNWMIEMGKQAGEFFEKRQDEFGRRTYHLKSMEQYSRERNTKEQPSKKYFQANTLPEIIKSYPMPRKNMKQSEIDREMNNRIAFIDFVRGLLTINPLERWSPQQAKLHPFITQQKYTGQFVPPMNLKASALNRSPAPGTQQQIQAEALSKQRAQAAQAQAQASTAAQGAYGSMGAVQYQQQQQQQPQHQQQQQHQQQPQQPQQQQGHPQQPPPLYGNNNMYTPTGAQPGAPPPYSGQQGGYGQMGMGQASVQMPPANYAQSNLYAQQNRPRQRASTMEQQQSGIPAAIQRVASHLDPTQPIRLQPSPAYYPPPPEGLAGMDLQTASRQPRRGSRAQQGGRGNNRDFIRNLEARTMEEGFMGSGQGPWH
ncbi:hypothetical protein CHGG_05572 [Chaetomium globosum CBS 148.51]|uniref:Protein kinase domain-containing protein n=1 Tax=Chaetomium globosum (strain ATCC 6205 / CBS 148.51 / DSM 1962 / NBRC 6347 / NRRL 1970) TaxID=306901 RepID=Q2H6Z3_CHAGB|nr:uncharacterized protein CHGG_05572 [Chaetomium globosum CBS 148.51]EAQ88953.1 hypothetical protein CHGG_05572 [Chaetomium globosum CBS 148.51]